MKTVIARIARARRTQIAIAGLLVLSGMAALAARHGKGAADAPLRLVVALPVHSLADPNAGDPRYPVEAAARYSNSMSFRVGGKLIERRVRLGDTVRKGEVVARLDPVDAAKQAASAQTALEAAEHRLLFAKQQLDRDMAQSSQNLISATQLEQTQDAYATALAGRDQAADQLVVARDTLAYQTLVADHDGVITSENADTGQVVSAGLPVYGLAWSGDVDAVLDATASDVETMAVGRYASVKFTALPKQSFDAHVREVSPSADPQSRTYRVKLTLSDPRRLVRLGMTGDARVAPPEAPAGDEHTFKVPVTALFHRGKDPAVWVICPPASTLELRPVTVTSFSERQVVISAGLRDGDTVVQAGVHAVYAGEHVKAVVPLFAEEGDGGLDADADPYAPNSPKPRGDVMNMDHTGTADGLSPAPTAVGPAAAVGSAAGSRSATAREPTTQSGSEDRFNLSSWALKHQQLVVFLLALITLLGVVSYGRLGQSEDPPFTFKVMVIRTFWPGATARQVQEELTDRIARKLQETAGVDFLRSYSRPGESTLFFNVKDAVPASQVPDTWYQVRKKVGDIAYTLPSGVQGPYFNDEFGDVYTNIYALEGDGFSPAQLYDYAERLRADLLRVPDVNKVDFIADQDQHVYVEISNAQLAKLGLSVQQISDAINTQNSVAGAGVFTTADDQVYVRPTGQFQDADRIADTLVRVNGRIFRLGDIATVRRGYADPPTEYMRLDGQNVLGIGVTMVPSGDVIRLGKGLEAKISQLGAALPAGLKLVEVSSMPKAVRHSIDDFIEAVVEAIAIVLIVSLISLGVRTGTVVAISIPLVLAATVLCMFLFHIGLHKVSLGTLVLALGLLVDDAIISVESMAVKLEEGFDRLRAAAFAYSNTAFPMLSGTLVTVSGFLPIALARSATGEYTRSIFEVSAIALLLSWLAAVVVIPLLGSWILAEHPTRRGFTRHEDPSAASAGVRTAADHGATAHTDLYDTPFYRRLHGWIDWCVEHRGRVLAITLGLFVLGLAGFALVPQQFFPSSDRPELLVDIRLPEGASFAATLREAERFEIQLTGRRDIDHYVDFVGSGAPRFYLPLDEQLPATNLAQFVVTAKNVKAREHLREELATILRQQFPSVRTRITRLENGPPVGFPVQFRVSGPEIGTVRHISEQVAQVMRRNPDTDNVQFDWDEPGERSVHFEVDQVKARQLSVSSQEIENYLQMSLTGYTVTQYRERDKLIAVDLRAPQADRIDPSQIERLAFPTSSGTALPLSELGYFSYGLESAVVWERDREPTITVQSDVAHNAQGIDVTMRIDKALAGVRTQLPQGYRIEIGGPVEENGKAQASINVQMPLLVIAVLTILMIQLQSISRVLMVVLTAPLGLIGVVLALLLFHMAFGFVAMLGTIAMFGIIMRNSVILVDQIEKDIRAGHSRVQAIIGATVRRFRPITLTAAAAVLALIPLLRSNFFGPMAAALMGGIAVATVLTLFYLPALYALWFRVRRDEAPKGVTP